MPKFLWMLMPVRDADGAGGAAPTPDPAAGGAAPEPAAPPAPTPATEGPGGNGSLVPDPAAPANPAAPADPADPTKPAEPPVAEPIDVAKLALPEGMKADDAGLAKLTEVLGDPKASPQERAQNLLNLYTENLKSAAEAISSKHNENYAQINTRWRDEVKADPVIGGAKMPEALAVVARALDAYGDGAALRKDLDLSGMGNNPHLLRMIHKMATQLEEGRPAQGGTPAGRKSMAEVFYPNSGTAAQS